jgi:hypothetical protein
MFKKSYRFFIILILSIIVLPSIVYAGCCEVRYVKMGNLGQDIVHAYTRSEIDCTGPKKQGSYDIIYTFYPNKIANNQPGSSSGICINDPSSQAGDNKNLPPSEASTTKSITLPEFTQLTNPLRTVSIPVVIGRVVKAILLIIGSLAFIMFVYGGVTWMTAAGNEQSIERGRNTLIWATLGLIIVFSAYVGVKFLLEAIGAI